MQNNKNNKLLRIYISSTDRIAGQLVYEKIVYMAKEKNLAGATVLRGVLGYGASSVIHSSKFWELTEKLPMVIEIVDEKKKIDKFYRQIEPMLKNMSKGCMVTIDPVNVKLYKAGNKK